MPTSVRSWVSASRPWTGGTAQYIVGYPGGKAGFVARARELAAKYGDRFTPPESLL